MDWTTILAAAITAIGAFLGVYIANRKQTALIAYRIEQLEKKQDKHNSIIERTFKLEQKVADLEKLIK